jgi:hypothetical protein
MTAATEDLLAAQTPTAQTRTVQAHTRPANGVQARPAQTHQDHHPGDA